MSACVGEYATEYTAPCIKVTDTYVGAVHGSPFRSMDHLSGQRGGWACTGESHIERMWRTVPLQHMPPPALCSYARLHAAARSREAHPHDVHGPTCAPEHASAATTRTHTCLHRQHPSCAGSPVCCAHTSAGNLATIPCGEGKDTGPSLVGALADLGALKRHMLQCKCDMLQCKRHM